MSPEVTAAIIAASVSFLTLIWTLAAQYFGRRATSRDAEKTLEERVTDLQRLLPAQIRTLSRLRRRRTASTRADIATIRAQMLAGFASVENKLDAVENRLGTVEQDLSSIKRTLDAPPRALAEEIAKRR